MLLPPFEGSTLELRLSLIVQVVRGHPSRLLGCAGQWERFLDTAGFSRIHAAARRRGAGHHGW